MQRFLEIGVMPDQVAELTLPQLEMFSQDVDGEKPRDRPGTKRFRGWGEYQKWRRERGLDHGVSSR